MRIVLIGAGLASIVLSSLACGGGGNHDNHGGAGGGGGAGGSGPPPVMPNDVAGVSESTASAEESEPHVVASSDGRVAVAWIGIAQTGASHIGYAFSTDGGDTFLPPAKVTVPAGMMGTDPVLAADDAGNVYLTWLGLEYTGMLPSNMHLYVAKAGPGATAFDAPVTAAAPGADYYDKPWIAITQKGTIVVSMTESDEQTFSRAVVHTSSDGAAWKPVTLPGPSVRSLVSVCASRTTPRLFATYITAGAKEKIALQWSDDEGATWSPEVIVSGADAVGFDGPTCVADGEDVWVSYAIGTGQPTANSFQQLTAVHVAHSTDGGQSFPAAVNAHDPASAKLFLHPALLLEGDGSVDAFYYGGAMANDLQAGFFSVQSKDKGATFDAAVTQHKPIGFDLSRADSGWLGDYFGVARRDGALHMAYVDNTNLVSHVSYRRAPAAAK